MLALMPVIGSGTRNDPYRADVPAGVNYHSANIRTDKFGVPVHLDAIVHFDDDLIVPPTMVTKLRSRLAMQALLAVRDPACVIDKMQRAPRLRDMQLYLGGGALAADSFDRADSTDLGTQWDAGYTSNNNLQIVGNRVRGTVLSADSTESYNAVTLPNNQWSQLTLASMSGAPVKVATVLTRAAVPPTFSWYQCAALTPGAAVRSELGKRVAGVYTILSNETSTTWGAGDVLRGESDGTTHTLYRNGSTTALLSATDSSHAAGRAGIGIYIDDSLANIEVDNWSAGPGTSRLAAMGMG